MAASTSITVLVLTTAFSSGYGNTISTNSETRFQEFASGQACAAAANLILNGPAASGPYVIDGFTFKPSVPIMTDNNNNKIKVQRHALCVDSGKNYYDTY